MILRNAHEGSLQAPRLVPPTQANPWLFHPWFGFGELNLFGWETSVSPGSAGLFWDSEWVFGEPPPQMLVFLLATLKV